MEIKDINTVITIKVELILNFQDNRGILPFYLLVYYSTHRNINGIVRLSKGSFE